MECNFSKRQSSFILHLKVGDRMTPQITRFKHFGFIMQNEGDIEAYVKHHTHVRWLK